MKLMTIHASSSLKVCRIRTGDFERSNLKPDQLSYTLMIILLLLLLYSFMLYFFMLVEFKLKGYDSIHFVTWKAPRKEHWAWKLGSRQNNWSTLLLIYYLYLKKKKLLCLWNREKLWLSFIQDICRCTYINQQIKWPASQELFFCNNNLYMMICMQCICIAR